jgi:hypothetical protein
MSNSVPCAQQKAHLTIKKHLQKKNENTQDSFKAHEYTTTLKPNLWFQGIVSASDSAFVTSTFRRKVSFKPVWTFQGEENLPRDG